ncbi:MAG: AraC family transcriptional regulator, partial [Hyphomicrobiaceae bacterium]
MSTAISVYHGPFGRAALYHLDRPMTLHAHREGHLVLHVASAAACLSVGGLTTPCDPTHAVAVNPWEIHDFTPCSGGDGTICLVLYIKPNWFAAHDAHGRHKLRFARSKIQLNDQLRRLIQLISLRLEKAAEDGEFDQCLFALTDGCYRAAGEQAGCDAGLCADKTGFNDF